MKTSHAYINEYSFLDEVLEAVESAERDIQIAFYDYSKNKRAIENKSFFEYVENAGLMVEKEGTSFLAKIGNAVMTIINKIASFLKTITDKITKNNEKIKDDVEIVNQMVARNPQLKNQVAKGIKEEWFTYKDVAAFEKDTIGLINMLEQNRIDHRTFREKFEDMSKKFADSAKPIITIGTTVGAVLGAVGHIVGAPSKAKKCLSSFHNKSKDFKKDLDTKYSEKDTNKAQAISWALGKAVGLITTETSTREASQGFLSSILGVLKTEKSDFVNKETQKKQAEKDEYYKKMEDNMVKNKEHQDKMKEIKDRVNGKKS